MNEAQIILTGNVANKPSLGTTPAGVSVANMRVGYTPRRLDRESGQWVDGQTSWLTVKCWRKLADHVVMCLNKGDPVVVRGVLQVRQYTDKDGNPRQAVEVLASAVGHDLTRGVTHFIRTGRKSGPVLLGAQGEAASAGSGQAGPEPADSEASGQHGGMRSVPGLGWDPARDGGDDPDDDMFDETAVVAAALHAVPDLGDPGGADDREPDGPASGGTGSPPDASPGPDAERAPKDPAPAGRRPGRIPAQRKAGARQPRREGTTDAAGRAGDGASTAKSPGTAEDPRPAEGPGAGAVSATGAVSGTGAGSRPREESGSGAPARPEPSLT